MSGDLARSLVDAAAEAMAGAHNDAWEPDERARLAVAAVLEALAAYCRPVAVGEGSTEQKLISYSELRQWADEVGEAT